jgi:hypothetical protein
VEGELCRVRCRVFLDVGKPTTPSHSRTRETKFPLDRHLIACPENRDLRQLLWHRHRLVQMRTRMMNQLQALAMNEDFRWKKKLRRAQGQAQLEKLSPAPWPVCAGKSCRCCWKLWV